MDIDIERGRESRGGSRNFNRGVLSKECTRSAPKIWGDHAHFCQTTPIMNCTMNLDDSYTES